MAERTIRLKTDGYQKDAAAGGTITPGHLIMLNSAGAAVVHNDAGGAAAKRFAIEDDLQGNAITDNYTSGNEVQYVVPRQGDEVLAILADGENATIDSFLESNGNGELRVYSADSSGEGEYPNSLIGVPLEAVNASDSAATAVADRRIKIEIL